MHTTGDGAVSTDSSSRVPLTLRDFFFADPFFQSAWDDFERIRQDMMRETREFWNRVESMDMRMPVQSSSSSSSSTMTSEKKTTTDGGATSTDLAPHSPLFFPRRWMFPRFMGGEGGASSSLGIGSGDGGTLTTSRLFPSDIFGCSGDDQVIRVKDDDSKFEISLDTHDYRPDELKVNINGNELSVEAKHEEKSENKFVSRQFSRRYTLPAGCEPGKVSSNLSSDGILMITAPKKPAIKDDGSRAVPIEMKS